MLSTLPKSLLAILLLPKSNTCTRTTSLRAHVDREDGQFHQILGHHVVKDRGDPIHSQRGVRQPQDPIKFRILEGFSRLADALCKGLIAHSHAFHLWDGRGSLMALGHPMSRLRTDDPNATHGDIIRADDASQAAGPILEGDGETQGLVGAGA